MKGKLTLSEFIPYQLVNLATVVSAGCASTYMDENGVSIPEWRILSRLAEHRSLRAKELALITFMDKSRVSRALKSLDEKAYIHRRVHEGDQRETHVSLSRAGRAVYQKIAPKALAWEREFLSVLSLGEYDQLQIIIQKLQVRASAMSTECAAEDEARGPTQACR